MSTITDPTTFIASRLAFTAQPRRMAAIAALRGATPPEIAGATVVDLGCGDAANLLAIAAAHPGTAAVGIDPSGAALDRAQALAADAGLTNVTLFEGTTAPLDDGSADFVICSDVLSYVDADARAAILAEAARLTKKGGLVLLSYDAIPGAVGRVLTRSIGRRAAADAIQAGDADATRVAVVSALLAAARNGASGPDFVALVTSEAERLGHVPAERVLHEELAAQWEPLAVAELAALASSAGLAYLGEVAPADRWRERLPESEGWRIVNAAKRPEAALQQQAADDVLGSATHASLFIRGAAPKDPIGGGARRPAGPPAAAWHAAPEHPGDWPELPASLKPVADELRAAGPAGLHVSVLAERTGASVDAVRQAASVLDAYGLARLDLEPALVAAEPGELPNASALALAQARRGDLVATSLRHREVSMADPRLREILLLLDGTRDRAALTAAIESSAVDGVAELAPQLEAVFAQFAGAGLLSVDEAG